MASRADAILSRIEFAAEAAEIAALQRLEGEMKRRIHTDGKGVTTAALDSFAPKKLGRYSAPYGRKRRRAGKTVSVKNLAFEGSLLRAYGIGKSGAGTNVIGFFYDRARLISKGQELQTRQQIFGASEAEIKLAQEVYISVLRRNLSTV